MSNVITINVKKRFWYDFREFQWVDSPDGHGTTYYGGSVKVNGKEYECYGNDRGCLPWLEEIERDLGVDYDTVCELMSLMYKHERGVYIVYNNQGGSYE